jgi:hypothetical protein
MENLPSVATLAPTSPTFKEQSDDTLDSSRKFNLYSGSHRLDPSFVTEVRVEVAFVSFITYQMQLST